MKLLRLLVIALTTPALAQGPLAPPVVENPAIGPADALTPGGTPQPTMKTLHQVEPRIAISALPFTILESGSYYFTRNLHVTAATGHAITVAASGVTIDLMGFALSSDPAVTGNGILIDGSRNAVTVRDGTITGTSRIVIEQVTNEQLAWTITQTGGFASGVGNAGDNVPMAKNCRFVDLNVSFCRSIGITAGEGSRLERCAARENIGDGFVFQVSELRDCTASTNGTFGGFYTSVAGSTLTSCIASLNEIAGFVVPGATVSHCQAVGNQNGFSGQRSVISHSAAYGNSGHGILTNSGSVINSTANNNLGDGISATEGTVTNCTANDNSFTGIRADKGSVNQCQTAGNFFEGIKAYRGSVSHCTATRNGLGGIASFGGAVTACTSSFNVFEGIWAPFGVVSGCKATENQQWGILANSGSISHCNATSNNTSQGAFGGIFCEGAVISFCYSSNNNGAQYATGSGATQNSNR